MTKFDVKQYLEKIYQVPVVGVRLKMLYHDRKLSDYQPTCRLPTCLFYKSFLRFSTVPPLDTADDKKYAIGSAFPHLLPREPERYEKVAYVHLVSEQLLMLIWISLLTFVKSAVMETPTGNRLDGT